jgi:hypothetical protein
MKDTAGTGRPPVGHEHTHAHGTDGKKFPVESWNYGYGDIGVSFGANRATALRAAVVTAAKTLKLDDIARSEQPIYLLARACTHVHGDTRDSADVSDFIIRIFRYPERGIQWPRGPIERG